MKTRLGSVQEQLAVSVRRQVLMRIGGAHGAPPPSQTGLADLPHPAFQSADFDGRMPSTRPLPATVRWPGGSSPHPRAQPCGTTSALARWPSLALRHCLPASLRSAVVTRFFATTNALTPAEPFVAPCRGSLIHVTRTSHHSVSNHLRFSTRRVPLPQRWPHYFVRASPCSRKLARAADRIEFTLSARLGGSCYGLVVHFPLLSTRGYRPDAVTFSYWPYSVGQVRDSHPAVPVRSQAHDCASPLALWGATVSICCRESARGLAQSKTLRAAPQSSKCSNYARESGLILARALSQRRLRNLFCARFSRTKGMLSQPARCFSDTPEAS
jgi:hypothetical protein